jgi:phosphoglycerate kinase
MEHGRVSDDTRIRAVLPTVRRLADKGGRVILLSHYGRPKGKPDPAQSLRPIAPVLAAAYGHPVAFAPDCVGPEAEAAVAALRDGGVLLLENTRFHAGEEANDSGFAKQLARLGDLYVNDAFSAAHRAHASTEAIARLLPAFAGRSMQAELEALDKALGAPAKPVMAIVGGAKISTKLELLGNLVGKVDLLAIGGAMANTFLAAEGVEVGRSLCERDLLDTARGIARRAGEAGCRLLLPSDAQVATELSATAPRRTVTIGAVDADEMILDIGPETVAAVDGALAEARTLVWNGPFGAFEVPPFDAGTLAVAQRAAALTRAGTLLSVVGGGDTVAAVNKAGVAEDFSYVSTAGGAFLEWLEGKPLPGVEALREAAPAPA